MIALNSFRPDSIWMSKANFLKNANPHIWAEYTLYPTSKGGKTKYISCGWSCPCFVKKDSMCGGFDAYPLLGNTIMSPSETRYLGLWFMNREEAEPTFKKAGKFYLWEGGFIGEAIVRPNFAGMTGNERLYAAGLLEAYDEAVLKKDQEKIADIMKRISLP